MSPVPVPAPTTEDVLGDAQVILKNTRDAPGKVEQAFDQFGGAVSSVNTFFEANSSVISAAVASLDNTTIDKAINGFAESVKVVMSGLDALGAVHPFIGVAVVAFKLVVSLDLTRRENNRKVIAVKVQMQQMMCTLFQLRRIKDPDEVAPDGTVLKDRMQPLIVQIAQDIEKCGSACDAYMKKSAIIKTIVSKVYEPRLAEYAAKFIDYRDQLDKALNIHIALGVDTANEKLDTQTTRLETIDNKLNLLMNMFRQLDTPREKEAREFVENSGGPENVIKRTDLLQSLVKKSGETMDNLTDKSLAGKTDIDSVKEQLGKELTEDVDVVLKQNFKLFHRKMKIQQRNFTGAMEKMFVDALSSGTHDKIKDPDLQNLWKEMAWKGSVKARHFVLALRDYFIDRSAINTPAPERADANSTNQAPSSTTLVSADHLTPPVPNSLSGLNNDLWALEYIDIAHLQLILEAIDDDSTGFISIKEANTFAVKRPKGWSLLHWIAFWAQGWEMSLASYKNKIILVLQEMDRLHENVLKANRKHVDIYLQCRAIAGIELILRSVNTFQEPQVRQELVSLTETYTASEEERLRNNLEDVGYDIDSTATTTLITGPGRIERYLLPLLYLTLKRHLGVFHYASRHVIDSKEFSHMSTTLGSIFGVVEQRIDSLKAIYKQARIDVDVGLENVALGMFRDFAVGNYRYGPRESIIRVWQDTSKTQSESCEAKIIENPEIAKPIFSFDPESQNDYRGTWQDWPSHSFDTNPYTGVLAGYWTGYFRVAHKRITAATGIQMKVEVDPGDSTLLKGYAVAWLGKFELYGRRRWPRDSGPEEEELDIVLTSRRDFFRLLGKLRKADEKLIGQLSIFSGKEDVKVAYDAHPFGDGTPAKVVGEGEGATATGGVDDGALAISHSEERTTKFAFYRTPAEVAGFRRILHEGDNKARARWNFLREAVLLLVRRSLWSWSYYKSWGADRRAFLDYYKRNWLLSTCNFATSNPLTRVDKKAWRELQYRLPPAYIRLCLETLTWSLYRLPFHYGVSCDGCGLRMIESRFICLTCLDPDMTNSFDLCGQCVDQPAQRSDFTHTTGHTLIKARQYVPQYFFAWLVNEARSATIRLKKMFIELSIEEESSDTQGVGENDAPTGGVSEVLCGCCTKPVKVPCWICITCVPETYICEDCEAKELPVLEGGPGCATHRPDHYLLRLRNLVLVRFEREKIDPTVAHINALETSVDKRLKVLESAVGTRIVTMESTVESRITGLEGKLRARLEALESLLAQVGPRFSALNRAKAVDSADNLDGSDYQVVEVVRTDA